MKVRYRARAQADIDKIFEFINARSPAGARNVLHALADAIDEIGAHPLASPVTSDADIRVRILRRYRWWATISSKLSTSVMRRGGRGCSG